MKGLLIGSLLLLSSSAQFFNPFSHHQQQQQQQRVSFEDEFLNDKCDKYLCPDTKECVKSHLDCPCPFPKSQLKCILPDKKNYVCISKPATKDHEVNAIYDDPIKGPKASIQGLRDCGWVNKAYKGLV
jgi:hypothetical protein